MSDTRIPTYADLEHLQRQIDELRQILLPLEHPPIRPIYNLTPGCMVCGEYHGEGMPCPKMAPQC